MSDARIEAVATLLRDRTGTGRGNVSALVPQATEMLAAADAAGERGLADQLAAALREIKREAVVMPAGHAMVVLDKRLLARIDAALARFHETQEPSRG